MSAIKARWRTYNTLQSLVAKVPIDFKQFKIEDVRPQLISIVREWSLEVDQLAKTSGLPPLVVANILGIDERRWGTAHSRNPNEHLSLAPDTRKLINGLLTYFGPSESELETLKESGTTTRQTLVALGPQARDFLDVSSHGISQLEAELCNLTKTNRIEVLAEIASAFARLRDQVPVVGLKASDDSEHLRREIAVLQAKVELLAAERDRLAVQLEKSLGGSDLKSGFWQAMGAAPVGAFVGAIGTLLGPESAQAAASFVQTLVATGVSGG